MGAIFVLPKNHGEGIGKALMDQAHSLHKVLELEVFEENSIGRAFYERYGFVTLYRYLHEQSGHPIIRLSFGA